MTKINLFVFNQFEENTYLVHDDTKECAIIDPGCSNDAERSYLVRFIEKFGLKPVRLINTHCHLDHIYGNKFVAEKYGLQLEMHEGELPVLQAAAASALFYGVPVPEESPMPGRFLDEGDVISFGETELEVIFTPGHSPASISLFCRKEKFVVAGDVLFYDSIGRPDLPGGDHDTLIRSIKEKLYPLGNDVFVYPGHGVETRIGREKSYNPFLNGEIDG